MIARGPVTTALAALIAAATGKPVGIGGIPAPVAPATRVDPPYYVLYPLDAGVGGPVFADDASDASFVYQLTSVSGPDPSKPNSHGTIGQAEWLADKARTAVLGRDPDGGSWINALTVAGVSCMCRELEAEPGATNDPADAIISYVQRFRLDLTPA